MNKITYFAYHVLRVAISRPCPAGPCRFQAAPLRTPAAIWQDTGSPGCWPLRPGAALMSLFLVTKVYCIFLIRKKKLKKFFKKYLILLIFNELQRAIFGAFSRVSVVKRFNSIILYIEICDRGRARARHRAGYQIKPRPGTRSKPAPY